LPTDTIEDEDLERRIGTGALVGEP
jgi:hypothetical protein